MLFLVRAGPLVGRFSDDNVAHSERGARMSPPLTRSNRQRLPSRLCRKTSLTSLALFLKKTAGKRRTSLIRTAILEPPLAVIRAPCIPRKLRRLQKLLQVWLETAGKSSFLSPDRRDGYSPQFSETVGDDGENAGTGGHLVLPAPHRG